MMHMEHRLGQHLAQRMILTQKMQQAIHILQLSTVELDQYLQEQLEANPVLEQIVTEPTALRLEEPTSGAPPAPNSSDGASTDDSSFNLDEYTNQWMDYRREGQDLSRNPELAEKRDYYQNSITKEESFSARLMTQLRLAATDEQTFKIGELILGEIDGKGYFTGSLEEIANTAGVPLDVAERALHLIQQFEPTGVGARDVVECLLLQIKSEFPKDEQLKVLVRDHLEDLEHRHIPKIAKAMNITPERVEELKELLATLNPWPGHDFTSDPPQYVTPDVIVEKIDDEYVVYPSDEAAPEVRISGEYRQMLANGRVKRDEKQYLRERLESAKWLIRNIEQRKQTILRIARSIVDVQTEFFDKGVEFIKPLTLQEIADKVGVHEATVSRATRGKYMQTPQGLFEMKYFFSPGLKHDSGGEQSSKSVQSLIKKIVEDEEKTRPLSDQKIADMLKVQGINIARRTVTKYREELGILSTTLRKSYQDAS